MLTRTMTCRRLFYALLLVSGITAQAEMMPYYRMDSLVLLSDLIVLCDEIKITPDAATGKTFVSSQVVRTFQGDLAAGKEFSAEYDCNFKRELNSPEDQLPPGRALLFLKKTGNPTVYSVVTAKLIKGDEVLQFGQFLGSIGPLSLGPQKPENLKLSGDQKYGEAELVADLLLALQKSASLKEPAITDFWEALGYHLHE